MYSVNELATILNVHRNTIIRAIKLGTIKAVKFGKLWKVTEEELSRIKKEGF